MKYALIDMGSNTVHLCVYEIFGREYKKLFKNKLMAGIAGYVEDGALSEDGIRAACGALQDFQEILNSFGITKVDVLATASLRNISNSEEAIRRIEESANHPLHILSGTQEAECGYYGILQECHPRTGFVADIGGGSTEITHFNEQGILVSQSFPLGSLNLYKRCIDGHILPTQKEQERMRAVIGKEFTAEDLAPFRLDSNGKKIEKANQSRALYAVGGTARAVRKLGNRYFGFAPENREFRTTELRVLAEFLTDKGQERIDFLLKHSPDRIHTIVPGVLILRTLAGKLPVDRIEICNAGVREGYIWEQTHSHK